VLEAEFAAMRQLPYSGPAAARGVLLAVLCAIAPVARGADPPDAGPGEAVAVGSGPLTTLVTVETLSDGPDPDTLDPRYVPADRIHAGDEVHYTIRVSNPGRLPVHGVMVTKRLPFGLTYVGGSAVGPAATVHFSVDSGESFAAASDLEVAATGQPARRALPADYTHVRWLLKRPLPAGATALLRFRATLG
jgi:uncharacterized repeat protein (TIGR01451 family)